MPREKPIAAEHSPRICSRDARRAERQWPYRMAQWLSRWTARGIVRHMHPPLFLPTARQTNWLLIVGFLALGQALYLRYLAIEHAPVSLACQGGLETWLARPSGS